MTRPGSAETRLDRDRLKELLGELNAELRQDGVKATIYVFGGAAIALGYDAKRGTWDADVRIKRGSHHQVGKAAQRIGRRHGLNADWMNEAGTAAIPRGEDPGVRTVEGGSNLKVEVASRRWMIAMKLEAGRDVDLNDVSRLAEGEERRNPELLADIHAEVYRGAGTVDRDTIMERAREGARLADEREQQERLGQGQSNLSPMPADRPAHPPLPKSSCTQEHGRGW